MPQTIWFNKSFSSLYNIIELIKSGDTRNEFRLLCTHENPDFVGFEVADCFEVEDSNQTDQEYLDYCLEMCRRYQIRLFLPAKKMPLIAQHRHAFENAGVRVLVCAESETLEVLNDKASFYQALQGRGLELPESYPARDLRQFDQACETLRAQGKPICFKPARSIYGLGFKIISDRYRPLDAFLTSDSTHVSLEEARQKLGSVESFATLLVMEYLEGPEYSIDVLAKDGRLVRGSVRKKPTRSGAPQLLERNEPVLRIAEKLTEHFHLTGLFNVQVRCGQGVPKLLEVNPRMAGGVYYSCLSGVNFPYWGMRLALEDCESEIPELQYGIRVNQVYYPFAQSSGTRAIGQQS